MSETNIKWILYDTECGICRMTQWCLAKSFEQRGFRWESLHADWVRDATRMDRTQLLEDMKVLSEGDGIYAGVDAWLYLARYVWWLFPLRLLGTWNLGYRCMDFIYRTLAANRHCFSGSCQIGGK
ncbi:MAG: DUF393 domain-containing protein [Verrucomicrobiae bacterium]|nr:DUF393 domain-containing protein [Verrucomicrobiae bacterium]